MIKTRHFYTYEDLLDFLDRETGFAPPRIIEGRQNFLGKFNKWFFNFNDNHTDEKKWKCIFPDPSLGLSYPYPIDEISVAASLALQNSDKLFAQQILNDYHLDEKISKRQTITLSGGELLLLNFAKAHTSKEITDRIFICTPTQWLHPTKYGLLKALIKQYEDSEKEINLLFMEGEESELNKRKSNTSILETESKIKSPIPWSLNFKDLIVEFEEQTFPKPSAANKIKYKPYHFDNELQSPTLLIGDNGVGKSVFVRLLSGIIKPTKGEFTVRCLGNEGYARVLMQDSLDQLFGETIDNHLSRVFTHDKDRGKKAKEIYASMLETLRERVKDDYNLRTKKLTATDSNFIETVLQVKFALTAERIESKPPLLILDEPDWCLSKQLTTLFTEIVVEIAHKNQIPVLIITHLNSWYSEYTNSILEFKKGKENNEVEVFKIK